MALFKPYKILSSQLNSLPIKEGQVIFTTDTKQLLLDITNNDRIVVYADVISKLANIDDNANDYVLPAAGAELGGVKTNSKVTNYEDYEQAPIAKDGTIYTKNAPAVQEFNATTVVFHRSGNANIPIIKGTKCVVSNTEPTEELADGDIWIVIDKSEED